jgi:hypothetical protein
VPSWNRGGDGDSYAAKQLAGCSPRPRIRWVRAVVKRWTSTRMPGPWCCTAAGFGMACNLGGDVVTIALGTPVTSGALPPSSPKALMNAQPRKSGSANQRPS